MECVWSDKPSGSQYSGFQCFEFPATMHHIIRMSCSKSTFFSLITRLVGPTCPAWVRTSPKRHSYMTELWCQTPGVNDEILSAVTEDEKTGKTRISPLFTRKWYQRKKGDIFLTRAFWTLVRILLCSAPLHLPCEMRKKKSK